MTTGPARPIPRRDLFRGAGLLAAGGLLAACGSNGSDRRGAPEPPANSGAGETIDLTFVGWTYSVDLVAEHIKSFEKANQSVKVSLQDYGWDQYHESIIQRIQSGAPADVIYNNGAWLAEFAKAGWVVPITDHIDFDKYKDDIMPYALECLTYKNEIYGLPYYSDIVSFMWNPTLAKEYGVDTAPESWSDVQEMSEKMKGNGLESPINFEFSQTDPTGIDAFVGMTLSRGQGLFDENLDPTFEDSSSAGYQQADFMAAAVKNKLAVLSPTEDELIKSMQTGRHVFTCSYNYELAAFNNEGQPLAGQFELLKMPGETHETMGYSRLYSMTKSALDRGDSVASAAARLIEAEGGAPDGEYSVVKDWSLQKGLGFGIKSLWQDTDIRAAFSKWVDVDLLQEMQGLAHARRQVEWTGAWDTMAMLELSRLFAGQTDTTDAMGKLADNARQLKKKYE